MNPRSKIKEILIRRQDKRYKRLLAERKVNYGEWVSAQERASAPAAVCAPDETAAFTLFVQRGGQLAADAEARIRAYFAANPGILLVYADEDRITEAGERHTPWYKPCWSPDTYRDFFYPGSVIAVRESLLGQAQLPPKLLDGAQAGACGVRRIFFDNAAQVRPYIDKLCLLAGGFACGESAIGHLDTVLFHAGSEAVWHDYMQTPETKELAAQLDRQRIGEPSPLVSIVIPSKDNPQVLGECLRSLRGMPRGSVRWEVIVVDNGSSEENRAAVEGLRGQQLSKKDEGGFCGMTYVYEPQQFNFSAMCNLGASRAAGSYLLFLNDDMEMCADDWLERMTRRASMPYVGSVGLKLYYPASVRIQHDGIVNLPVGPVHKLQFMDDDRSYYFGRNRYACDCAAATGACLMLRTELFRRLGGFCESLRVAYNDVELGFRLLENGYVNVVLNDRFAYHHESLSRGTDETPEKQERLAAEREQLYTLHPGFRGKDPYYPEGLNREGLDSRVVPGYLTARNSVQESGWRPFRGQLGKIRRDDCLMARVETTGPERIQGYSVVLGDDNACYDFYLLLIAQQGGSVFSMKLAAAYRQDLEENLPDQTNVALGGFIVRRQGERLPAGDYRIGVLAVNRVTGLRLYNETGKGLKI